jgi:hypothetical protein
MQILTDFSGLVEYTAERKRDTTLYGQRKCSEADSPLGYPDVRQSTLEGPSRE